MYLPDDQLEPDNKRTITLTPAQELKAGTEHTVVLSTGLLAKNGNAPGEEITVSLTTAD